MVDEKSNKNEIVIDFSEPVLEAPPSPELPTATGGTLFGDDSLAMVTSKLAALEAMLNIATADHKFNDFMRELLLLTMKVVRSEAGSILELDYRHNCLFFRSVVGQSSDKLSKFTVPMGKGIVGHVAESRQPLVVANVEENKVYLKSIQDAVGFQARNLICVPIIIRGKVFGVLELLNRVGEANYTTQDVELLTYLCDMAAKAIEIRLMLAWAIKNSSDKSKKEAA